MSYKAFLQELKKGLPLPVYFFYSSEAFLLREVSEEIKKLIPEEERDFNFHIFDLSYSEDVSFQQMLDVANTISFFGKRRFVILSGNIQKLPKKDLKKLTAYIAKPAPSTVFLIMHDRALKREMREMFKSLKPLSLDIREAEIPYWIKKRGLTRGLEISDEVAAYLIGIAGPDLALLSSEIEKISLLGKRGITIDDVSDIVAGGRLYSIFDLVNALKEKDAEKVFRIYKILRETTEDYSLIGALNWQYERTMHFVRIKKKDEHFYRLFEALNEADKDIKSSGRTFPTEYLLVKLLRLQEGPS